jgi:hypothetical protein
MCVIFLEFFLSEPTTEMSLEIYDKQKYSFVSDFNMVEKSDVHMNINLGLNTLFGQRQ